MPAATPAGPPPIITRSYMAARRLRGCAAGRSVAGRGLERRYRFGDRSLVETHVDVAVYVDDRHAQLVGFRYHFLLRLQVFLHVMLGVRDAVFLEVLLGHLAVHAAGGRIDDDVRSGGHGDSKV